MVQLPLKEVFALNDIRVRFVRDEAVKYISHLDLMKVFDRAMRRAGVQILYSQGFNPHPQMVFGLPLSVGVTSEAEYADFELSQPMSVSEFVHRANGQLPSGLKILEAEEKHSKANIMATISQAVYEIVVYTDSNNGKEIVGKAIDDILSRDEVIVKKEGKKGLKDLNIRPMINEVAVVTIPGGSDSRLKIEDICPGGVCENERILDFMGKSPDIAAIKKEQYQGEIFCISARLSAGSAANLKPELLISALEDAASLKLNVIKIHRTGLFISKAGKTLKPLDKEALSDA